MLLKQLHTDNFAASDSLFGDQNHPGSIRRDKVIFTGDRGTLLNYQELIVLEDGGDYERVGVSVNRVHRSDFKCV